MTGLTLRRRPWLIVAISLLASGWIACVILAWVLQENGQRRLARHLWVWGVAAGGLLLLVCLSFPVYWIWLAVGLCAYFVYSAKHSKLNDKVDPAPIA